MNATALRVITYPRPINILLQAMESGKICNKARTAIARRDIESFFRHRKRTEDREVFENVEQKFDVQTIKIITERNSEEIPLCLSNIPIFDVSRAIDGAIKNYSKQQDGLVIASVDDAKDEALVFMEFENYAARDLHNYLNKVINAISGKNKHSNINTSHILSQYLPIPFQGKQLNYGTWGRPALINNNPKFLNNGHSSCNISLHILNAYVETFDIQDKKELGFHYTDITDKVKNIIKKSKNNDGIVVVTTQHTTVGITTTKPECVEEIRDTIMKIAPVNKELYEHNKLDNTGKMKKDPNGVPLGDGNGQSHVQASLIGSFTAVRLKEGNLDIGRRRIYSMDCDVLPPRKRRIVVSIINNSRSVTNGKLGVHRLRNMGNT